MCVLSWRGGGLTVTLFDKPLVKIKLIGKLSQ